MTSWGQHGPLAHTAGHDINYIAITGALHAIGRNGERPVIPLNLVGDMGGGGMLLMIGILAALLESRRSGKGQTIDCAMVDGTAQQLWMFHTMLADGTWNDQQRESNLLDGGAYFYDTYECADGRHIALRAIEPQFHQALLLHLGLDAADFAPQEDPAPWPKIKRRIAEAVPTKSRNEWCDLMEGTDACFAPVLSFSEAPLHPANATRNVYVEIDGVTQAAPAPRFSRTPSHIEHGPRAPGCDTQQVLGSMGFSAEDIAVLTRSASMAAN